MSDEETWRGVFNEFDKDGSGSVCCSELKALLLQIKRSDGELLFDESTAQSAAQDIMEECDQNADGKISWDEFSRALKKNTCK